MGTSKQAAAAAAALGLALACEPAVPAGRGAPAPRRVILLGLDAATLRVMEPMVDRGELPAFARIRREGAWGPLSTIQPTLSVIIWTSMLTSRKPAEHGIEGWLSESGEQLAYSSDRIKKPPLWRILASRGVGALWLNFWASWPAEAVPGGMVSNRMRFGELANRAHPAELEAELAKLEVPARKPGPPDAANPLAGHVFHEDDRYVLELAHRALASPAVGRPRLLGIYLRGLDLAEHGYWHTVDPTARRNAPVGDAPDPPMVELCYRYLDGELARLMAAMPDATVVVVSDHGMEAVTEAPVHIAGLIVNRLLEKMGWLAFEPWPEGQPRRPGKRPIGWGRTRAYAFGDSAPDLDRGLRVNLVGREPDGLVSPADLEATVAKLAAELEALETLDGKRLFVATRVLPAGDSRAPDVQVDINREVTFEDVLRIGEQEVPVRDVGHPPLAHNSGQHESAPPGVLLMLGPGVKRGVRFEGASIYDVAPTLLALLGLPAARDMAGHPLAAALDFEPPPAIGSYGDLPFVPSGSGKPAASADADEKTMEDLRALGYIQ